VYVTTIQTFHHISYHVYASHPHCFFIEIMYIKPNHNSGYYSFDMNWVLWTQKNWDPYKSTCTRAKRRHILFSVISYRCLVMIDPLEWCVLRWQQPLDCLGGMLTSRSHVSEIDSAEAPWHVWQHSGPTHHQIGKSLQANTSGCDLDNPYNLHNYCDHNQNCV
jgi:hypothetical protein